MGKDEKSKLDALLSAVEGLRAEVRSLHEAGKKRGHHFDDRANQLEWRFDRVDDSIRFLKQQVSLVDAAVNALRGKPPREG